MESPLFTLYVQTTKNSLKTIEYVHERLGAINKLGAKVRVIKLKNGESPKKYSELKKNNVKSLPALITPERTIIGSEKIIDFFEGNITRPMAGGRIKRRNIADYESFMENIMFDETGAPRTDGEENDNAATKNEFSRRMSEFPSREAPPRGSNRRPPPRQTQYDEDEDNVPMPPMRADFDSRQRITDLDDRAIEERMVQAMLSNSGGGHEQ